MAKIKFLPKGEISTKIKLGTQYRALKTWLFISVILNLSLIGILTTYI